MRLGGFWGMTAPVLLLAFPDVEEIKKVISAMQRTVNTDILSDLKSEFYMLSKVADLTVIDTGLNSENSIFVKKAQICVFSQGHLMRDDKIDEQDAEFVNELIRMLAEMIIKGEQKGKYVNLDGDVILALRKYVTEWINQKDFDLLHTKQVVRGLYKSMIVSNGTPNASRIVDAFQFRRVIPDSIMLNGEVTSIDPVVKSVCSYYVNKLDVIYDVMNFITSDPMHEEKILDISFYDLIKRKPISFLFIVLSKFEVAKYKPSANLIRNAVESVKNGVDLYRECIEKHVSVYGENDNVDIMTKQIYAEKCSGFDAQKRNFFSRLQYDDLSIENFNNLSLIYDRISCLTPEFFNKEFGVSLSIAQWEHVFQSVCDLFVCGLNFHTLELFQMAISTITLTSADTVHKSKEYMDSLGSVLEDVDSLLSTIRPIGEAL